MLPPLPTTAPDSVKLGETKDHPKIIENNRKGKSTICLLVGSFAILFLVNVVIHYKTQSIIAQDTP